MIPRRFFRTPIAIGMLSGALAGSAVLIRTGLSDQHTSLEFYANIQVILQCFEPGYLILLPAYLAMQRFERSFLFQLSVFTLYVLSVYVVPLFVMYFEQPANNAYYYTAWKLFTIPANAVLLGWMSAWTHQWRISTVQALRWSLLGSLPSLCIHLAIRLDVLFRWMPSENPNVALEAMLDALALTIQGAVAAIPFEKQNNPTP